MSHTNKKMKTKQDLFNAFENYVDARTEDSSLSMKERVILEDEYYIFLKNITGLVESLVRIHKGK